VKTFLRKLKLSFLAMLCGWIACNIAMWVVVGYYEWFTEETSHGRFYEWIPIIGAISGIEILSVWLIIFLPVDLLVHDDSWLRQPKTAAGAGFVSAFGFVLVCSAVINPSSTSAGAFLMIVLLAGLTGSTAAYVRARMDERKFKSEL
jgi:hypothetical protein